MRALGIIVLFLAVQAFAGTLEIVPTTTLTAETSNNTSAANTWTTSGNGNLGARNISKVDHHTLLYPGATTKLYSHLVLWFGPSNHIQVGYQSNTTAQVKKTVDDNLSRGFSGSVIDWYGPKDTWTDGATLKLKQYAESLPGYPFKFALMEDKGALNACANTAGCDLNLRLASDLTYIVNSYASSPAYMKFHNRPAIFFFGLERFGINWDWVALNVPGNPLFIFQNAGGFTHADSGGGFAWVQINTSNSLDWEQGYLDYFYQMALGQPALHTFATTYKGFNDTAAAWSQNRIMSQQCGKVWLNTWNEIAKYYNSARPLESLQIVTWNDYEEGTEIESGIDNCVTIDADVIGHWIAWSITGNQNTLDHFTVFISTDGEHLMPLGNAAAGSRALYWPQFNLAPGSYILYVKAVGKPSFVNHMSEAVRITVLPALIMPHLKTGRPRRGY